MPRGEYEPRAERADTTDTQRDLTDVSFSQHGRYASSAEGFDASASWGSNHGLRHEPLDDLFDTPTDLIIDEH